MKNENRRESGVIDCVAIDDEPLALDVIGCYCRRAGNMRLRRYCNPREGLEAVRSMRPDLVFLDVEMGEMSGLSIAKELEHAGICVVFVTAHLRYASDGFDLDAADYLHKPFSYERFERAVEKSMRRIDYNRAAERVKSITVKQEYNNVNIPLSDILYVEAMEGYSKIFRSSGVCTLSRIILKNVEAMLPEREFLRIHRSYIVNVSKIEGYTQREVRLAGGKRLPIGRQYAEVAAKGLRSS